MAITLRTVRDLKPNSVVWDDDLAGFGVRKQRRDAIYVLKYRANGIQRFYTIGKHGALTPDKARREAKRLLGLIATGRDPQTDKLQSRELAADTLARTISDYLAFAKGKQKPRSYVETERHLNVNWKPLAQMSIYAITRRHVAGQLKAIERAKGAVTAARSRAALSALMNWAIREGIELNGNPVQGTNRPTEPRSRDRVLSKSELATVWRASDDGDYGRIVRLLIACGQRRDEVGAMQWSEIDFDKSLWTIPGARTKNHQDHTVPLTSLALSLLSPRRNSDFVFGANGNGFSGWSKSKIALDGRVGFEDWRLHDIRRTVATMLGELGLAQPHVIESLLNHISGYKAGIVSVYQKQKYTDEIRDALGKWGDYVARL
jgi:integrase